MSLMQIDVTAVKLMEYLIAVLFIGTFILFLRFLSERKARGK